MGDCIFLLSMNDLYENEPHAAHIGQRTDFKISTPIYNSTAVRAYLQRVGHTRLHIRTRHPPLVRRRPLDRSNRSNRSTFVRVTDARDAFT